MNAGDIKNVDHATSGVGVLRQAVQLVGAQAGVPMSGAIPAGAAHIGQVSLDAAVPAGNNNIGDVDIVTIPALVTGAATIGRVLPSMEGTSFYAHFDRIVPGTNKYMATLFNGSALKAIIEKIICFNNYNGAAVTGVLLEQYLAFITARTVGTTITIQRADSAQTAIDALLTADHNTSPVTERDIITRFWTCNEEMILAATGFLETTAKGQIIYERKPWETGIVCNNGQGASIRNVTASTIANCSYLFMGRLV